ncbi:MAG: amino acid adenylation domain-containing protein [Calditrichia bacterium]
MGIEKGAVNIPELVRVSRENPLPLSFSQQRLWFLDKLKPDNPTYNIPSAIRFKGNLDIPALKKSIENLVRRHEILRTCFGESDGQPVQIISENFKVELSINDLSEIPTAVQEDKAREIAKKEALKPFDLKNGPLFRVALLRLAAEDHIVLFTMHHTVSDGWSVGVLIHEISVSYDAVLNNSAAELPELKIQYADYAAWQRKLLSGPVYDNQLAYWKNQLDGIPPVLELPFDRPRPSTQSSRGANRSVLLSRELTDKLRELSRRESVTLFMTVLAAFQSLLQRLSGQNDVVVGTPIAGRTHLALENLIGFFVNTLALRANFSESPTFRELLRQVRDVTLGAYRHQDLPFEKLVEELHPVRDMSHQPIFQVMLVFQNLPMQAFGISDLSVEPFLFETGTAAFDLSLIMMETEDGLISNFEYNADLFDESTIERMLEHFELLLQNIVADPDQKVAEIPILTDFEKEKLFVDWNCTETEYPSNRCVHEWFESIAAEQPEAIAAIFQKDEYTPAEQVSYGRLNAHANNLAARLVGLGIGPDKLVGICMERSFEMVYAILAVLKAGGAFVPIDPAYPAERIEYMLNDSGTQILLTQSNLVGHLSASSVQVLCLDEELDEIQNEEGPNLNIPVTPDNLAYVIYTSGSTGKPKGTMLRHRGMCNLATAQVQAFGVGPGSRIFQFSSLSFDASVWELAMAFLSGAALCLTSRETVASGHSLAKVMKEQKVNVITLPPSVLAVLPEEELPDLKVLITAGEAVSNELVRKWSAGRKFFNAYGPTETTVCASMYLCEKEYPKGPPIGRPISNFKLYILDSHFQQVPIGVAGELCVDGVGLARGYLNRPGLTAEKFIPNIFSREKGTRLYRTGDLARFLPNGNIEFLGRIDTQVKIRGFRIELGEIEAVLNQVHDVRDAAVVSRKDNSGEGRLVAYFVPGDSQEINIAELRKYMRGKLPDYMIPSAFVKLDKIPLTPSGKLDHKSLPLPEFSRQELSAEYVAPRNAVEKKLVEIVSGLLKIDKVGVYDNFFELGGHSLLATQFMSRLRETFGLEIPLRILFEKPVIAEVAAEIELAHRDDGEIRPEPIPMKRASRAEHRINRSELN